MRSDIVPGATFPDYELPDHTDVPRRLSELQGDDPMILTLARGHYCPKEHQQHLELAAFYPKIAVAYTQIATIATDEHHTLQEFRASVGAQWPFLSDPGRIVQQDLDIQEYTDPDHDPMIPHTLVLKPGLVVHRIYNGRGRVPGTNRLRGVPDLRPPMAGGRTTPCQASRPRTREGQPGDVVGRNVTSRCTPVTGRDSGRLCVGWLRAANFSLARAQPIAAPPGTPLDPPNALPAPGVASAGSTVS